MTKKARTILFLICLFLFLLIAPLAIFYSLGYRIDFNSKKIVQTGAFYFKVWPKNAEVYLDGKLKRKTDLFFGSVFIDNLLPKKYEVEIKKAEFHPWKKTLEIKEKGVTESKNVFLIPENLKFDIQAEKIEEIFFSPDGKQVIVKEIGENGWSLEIFDSERNIKNKLFEEKDFLGERVPKSKKTEVNLLDLEFSPDSKKALLETREGEKTRYWILELPIVQTTANLISLDFLGEVEKISFNPESPQKMFFISQNSLFEADFIKKEKNKILEDLIDYKISDGNIFGISKDGFLFKTDFSGKIYEKLNFEPIVLKNGLKYEILIKGERIFLLENDVLYFFDEETKKFEKIYEKIKGLEISPDLKKILFYSDYEIWILFLHDIYDQPQRKIGEKLFVTRFSEKIEQVFWYTSHYLIFNAGNKLKIAEIDDRDKANIYDLAEFASPKMFFNQSDKKLYILSEEKLLSSERLLP